MAMGPGRGYCPAQNNIIRVRRLKECPLFRHYFVLTKVLSSCTFNMALATCRKTTADRSLDQSWRQCEFTEFVQLVCVTMRNKSHVLVTLLSRECLYSGNWRSILSVRYYVLLFTAVLSRARDNFLPWFRYLCAQNSVLNPTVLESFYWTVAWYSYERKKQTRLAGLFRTSRVLHLGFEPKSWMF